MLLTQKVRITSLLEDLWKRFLFLILVCVASHIFNKFILSEFIEFPGSITSFVGTAIAFFIGFNNNQAYNRWWEARMIWGSLVNDSRSFTRQVLHNITPNKETTDNLDSTKRKMVRRHIAFVYALKEKLRDSNERDYKKYLSEDEYNDVEKYSNKYNRILEFQSEDLQRVYNGKEVDGFRFIEINKMLVAFTDEMGKSERIKNTIFPTVYIRYTLIYIFVLIIGVVMSLGSSIGPWSILVGSIIGGIFITIHHIGMLLMDPFEPIMTGIPLNQITRTIEINLLEMLGEKDIPKPISGNGVFVM